MKLTKAFSADVSVSDGERAVTARISSAAVDRDGEVLIPQGMNAKDFEKNPIVFLAHNYYGLPVGKVASLKRDDSGWTAKVVFAARPDTHPTGEEWVPDTLFSLFQQGILKGFSVGFTVKESRPATDKDLATFGAGCRRVISKWTLLELSVAPLPCNQDAVALAVSKGTLSPETAKGVWGVEAKAGDPGVAVLHHIEERLRGLNERSTAAAAERKRVVTQVSVAPTPAPVVELKRVVYYVPQTPAAPAVDYAAAVKAQASAALQKARGRIYLID